MRQPPTLLLVQSSDNQRAPTDGDKALAALAALRIQGDGKGQHTLAQLRRSGRLALALGLPARLFEQRLEEANHAFKTVELVPGRLPAGRPRGRLPPAILRGKQTNPWHAMDHREVELVALGEVVPLAAADLGQARHIAVASDGPPARPAHRPRRATRIPRRLDVVARHDEERHMRVGAQPSRGPRLPIEAPPIRHRRARKRFAGIDGRPARRRGVRAGVGDAQADTSCSNPWRASSSSHVRGSLWQTPGAEQRKAPGGSGSLEA